MLQCSGESKTRLPKRRQFVKYWRFVRDRLPGDGDSLRLALLDRRSAADSTCDGGTGICERVETKDTPVEEKARSIDAAEADRPELNEDQLELLASLERAFQQAERGETRCVWEFMEEWRLEREAEDLANA